VGGKAEGQRWAKPMPEFASPHNIDIAATTHGIAFD